MLIKIYSQSPRNQCLLSGEAVSGNPKLFQVLIETLPAAKRASCQKFNSYIQRPRRNCIINYPFYQLSYDLEINSIVLLKFEIQVGICDSVCGGRTILIFCNMQCVLKKEWRIETAHPVSVYTFELSVKNQIKSHCDQLYLLQFSTFLNAMFSKKIDSGQSE